VDAGAGDLKVGVVLECCGLRGLEIEPVRQGSGSGLSRSRQVQVSRRRGGRHRPAAGGEQDQEKDWACGVVKYSVHVTCRGVF
jgi:hypothetical protein